MSTRPQPKTASSSAKRTRAYRERLRAQGLKPVTIWTYDMKDPVFRAALRAASLAMRDDPEEQAIMDEIEALQAEDDWT